MGSVRTLLALAVVFAHSFGYVFVGGRLAVQLFYLISGFLISYVISESDAYSDVWRFYANRFLRIYPIYYAVAGLTLASIFAGSFLTDVAILTLYRQKFDGATTAFLIGANILVFGQDWTWFTAVRDGSLHFSTNFRESDAPVFQGLLITPAWTLGVELSFYLIAPFVLRHRRRILVCLLASLLLRLALVIQGIGLQDPWIHRCFPLELALFLFGALSQQVWMPLLEKSRHLKTKQVGFFSAFIFTYCGVFFLLPYRTANTICLLVMFVLCLPHLFSFQQRFKWDRLIGELSYPIYISHRLVIKVVSVFSERFFPVQSPSILFGIVCALLAVVSGILLNRFVATPIESVRRRIKRNQLQSAT